ncbi:heavy metal-associated domain-containing protein [Clostridium sp. LIBA-8841]|uniref:heavy-metal-associated domain-containing protein n=1 Tax=Clostridium sp. LIBA-8841 TaxID=2987530 RepID=UPI002AC5476D|nr:heavy metal-associated domain-containing protein [Clostridium sp. LIBA-8841]MDZ4994749.1 heavy metal transporter [Clostridium perfringens]MDZ5252100.1 heavy-metal-associated domain-containing protein [Clostridium sp. LIBA-8841]
MDKIHYLVDGLGSSTNKTQVKNALENISGVQKVCVDVARGSIEVMFNENTSEDEIRGCIENTGFPIRNY